MEILEILSYFCSLESENFFQNGIHPKFSEVHTIPLAEGENVRSNFFCNNLSVCAHQYKYVN
jgi:hypothetical protein